MEELLQSQSSCVLMNIDKKLGLVVMDCLTSSRLDGVSFTSTITDNVTLYLGQFNSSANGDLELKLTSNGIYNSIVYLPGYITLRHSYQVDIDMSDYST